MRKDIVNRKRITGLFLAAAMAFTIAGSPFCVYAEGQSEEQSDVQSEGNQSEENPLFSEEIDYSDSEYVEGEVIVCFRTDDSDTLTRSECDEIADDVEDESDTVEDVSVLMDLPGEPIGEYNNCVLMLVRSETQSTEEIIAEMEARDDVLYAEPNIICSTSTEDMTGSQYNADFDNGMHVQNWNTFDEVSGEPTPLVDTSEVVVAVLDTGIDYLHEDLKNVMWDEGENYPSLVAMGGGKYGICVIAKNSFGFEYNTTDPMDDDHHGTHCAGIIGAEWNGIGVSGITTGTKLMAVKQMNNQGFNTIVECIYAYDYVIAAKKAGVNVKVASNSWHDTVFGHTMDILVREAGEEGIVSIFAAGNRTSAMSSKEILQGTFYNNPYVVVVGASDNKGEMTDFSNYSRKMVDIFAPGSAILSTMPRRRGEMAENASVYEKDGVSYTVDYSAEDIEVVDNHIDCLIPISGAEADFNSYITEEELPGVGKVIKVQADNEAEMPTIMSDYMGEINECVGGYIDLYVDHDVKNVSTNCYNPDVPTDKCNSCAVLDVQAGIVRAPFVFYPAGDPSKNESRFQLFLEVGDLGVCEDHVYIKGIYFSQDAVAYKEEGGTSMATPAVAGEAAMLVGAFPDDGPDKIAARIIGSARPYDALHDKCVSGGIADVSKAMAGEYDPVVNVVELNGDQLTISGFFFGDDNGSVNIGDNVYDADSWSDTEVSLTLPKDFEAGEYEVRIVSSDGRSGRRFDRIGTPRILYDRLPLPGRSLSGKPGTYTVTSDEFDDTFYGLEMQSIVGCDGNLYAINCTKDLKTAIFKYDIDAQTWEQVYYGGEAADSGVCTWKGKVLFFANDMKNYKSYICVFDPETNDVEYYKYNDEYAEKDKVMINNGKGIYVACGEQFRIINEDYNPILRIFDEDNMTLNEMQQTNGSQYICGNSMCLVYDDETLYYFGGNDYENDNEEMYKINPASDGKTFELVQINGENDKLIDGTAFDQTASMSAYSLADGFMVSGRVVSDENEEVITADTYVADYGDKKLMPTEKQMNFNPVYNVVSTAYKDVYYAMGVTNYENGQYVFIGTDVKTKPQYGDVVRVKSASSDGGNVDREGVIKSYVGANEVFTIKPEDGYKVAYIEMDGRRLSDAELAEILKAGGINFDELLEDHEIYVAFEKEEQPVEPDKPVTPDKKPDTPASPAAQPKAGNVKTGDKSDIQLYYVLMLMSLMGSVGCISIVYRRKGQHK